MFLHGFQAAGGPAIGCLGITQQASALGGVEWWGIGALTEAFGLGAPTANFGQTAQVGGARDGGRMVKHVTPSDDRTSGMGSTHAKARAP